MHTQNPKFITNILAMENKPTICLQIITSFLSLICITLSKLIKLLLKHTKHTTPRPPLPPGPTGWPFIGCLPEMIKNRPTSRWMLELMQRQNTEIACIRLGRTHVIPVTSPELAREFLRQQDEIFVSRPDCMSGRLCSGNFLSAVLSPAGPQWRKMRKIVSAEVLSPSMHKFLHPKRCQEADHLVRYVFAQCVGGADNHGLVDVRHTSQHYCGNVIRKLVFGKRFFGPGAEVDGGPGKEEIEHVDGLFSILHNVYGFAIADYAPWLEVFDFDGCKRIINEAIRVVNKYQDPEIMKRVEMWRQGRKTTTDDILDVLIKTDNPALSVQEIKAQITEIMIGAIDNPSNAAEWAIAEMINQPDILDRACQELDRVVGRDRLVEESDLPKLNYIKSCVKESFRLHPINRFNLPHVSTRDTVVGGYMIPKGSQVLLSRPGLGRNPRVWKDALEYKPERHMEDKEVVLVDHELRMISFGTGRRGCPAVVLGSTMATMLLARLLQGFSWEAPLDGPGYIELVESKNDMYMAKPLVALVRPRLELKVYKQLS